MHPILRTRTAAIAAVTIALTAAFAGGAVAASKITSADIKDHTIQSKDLKNGAVQTKQVKDNSLKSDDLKNESVKSEDLKNGTVATEDLKNGSVTASKLAPGAIAFPNSLWSTVLRNQSGAAQSYLQAGPTGQEPMGSGSLALKVTGTSDLAAFGDSIDFLGVPLASITELGYSTYSPDGASTAVPSLRLEINPHLVSGVGGTLEFTTLTYEPPPAGSGWVTHADIQDDAHWYLSGSEGDEINCTQPNMCTLTEVTTRLVDHADADPAAPAISSGVYFGLGSGLPATEAAVDEFVFNGSVFDFEPSGVFLTPAS